MALRALCREIELGNMEDPELEAEIKAYWKRVADFNDHLTYARNCRNYIRRIRERICKLGCDYNVDAVYDD